MPRGESRKKLSKDAQDRIRATIQCKQLVNMLTQVALTGAYNGQEVSPARLKAAELLLSKSLPSLSQVEQHNTGEVANPVVVVPQALPPEDWQRMADHDMTHKPQRVDKKLKGLN